MAIFSIWQLSLGALCFYIASRFINSRIRENQFRKFAQSKGAVPAFQSFTKLPWGIDGLYRMIRAAKTGEEDIYDDIFVKRIKEIGRFTHSFTGIGGIQTISTCEPENIKAVLGTQFHDFEIGERRKKQFGVLLGHSSIFNSDGEVWSKARALFRPLFSRSNLNDLDETEKAVQTFLEVIPKGQSGWTETFDISPLFYHFTMDTATAFIFGQSVDTQGSAAGIVQPDELAVGLAEGFAVGQEWLGMRIMFQGLYWICDGLKYRDAVRKIHRFAYRTIDTALQRVIDPNEKAEQDKYSVVEELAKTTQDRDVIRDQVIALLAAGRDTTSTLLSWMFYVLATQPKVFSKLRAEIIEHFGEDLNNRKKITFEGLKSCRYLQHFINETLRMYPTVPLNMRTAAKDTTIPRGGGPDQSQPVPVRKGQIVGMVMYAMHRREDLWGEDSNVFRPERFENRKLDWSFLPFSGGPRVCLGQQYAITEASYLTVRFLQAFDGISWEGLPNGPGKGFGLTMVPRTGIHIRLRYAAEKL